MSIGRIVELRKELTAVKQQLAEANEKLAYAKNYGLSIGRMVTTDKPEGFWAHEHVKGSTLDRIFDEWSDSIGIKEQLNEVTKQRDGLADALKEIATGTWCIKTCVDVIAPRALEQANAIATKGGES